MLHNACVDVPFPFKEGGGNGEVPHYAHENGCSTYLLFKSASLVKLNQLSYFSKSRLFISLTIFDVLYYYFFGI